MSTINPVVKGFSQNRYVYKCLKSLDKLKGDSIALDVLYKIGNSSHIINIDPWVMLLLKKYDLAVITREHDWFLENGKSIELFYQEKESL